MKRLAGKKIVVGVTGGIAAYKAAELVRLLKGADALVRVVMTPAAREFVTPLTFHALSGMPVGLDESLPGGGSAMDHIELARWADWVLVAPATADFMARLRAGQANDLLSTLCLATLAPLVLAPAMNRAMWDHPATRENSTRLQERGVSLLGPAFGAQACGETGAGRMLEPLEIVEGLAAMMGSDWLRGVSLLLTAGPTREPIDPVRYLTNRSSGKMGYALAEAASWAGAETTLVSGPTNLQCPPVTHFIAVESAHEMYEAVMERVSRADIFVGTAAVADYAPVCEPRKIKKSAHQLTLRLDRTRDILGAVAALSDPPFTVGFAAETHDLERYARGKLKEKALAMVAGNRVGQGLGFEVDENELYVCWPGGETRLSKAPKTQLAGQLIRLIAEHYHAQNTVQDS